MDYAAGTFLRIIDDKKKGFAWVGGEALQNTIVYLDEDFTGTMDVQAYMIKASDLPLEARKAFCKCALMDSTFSDYGRGPLREMRKLVDEMVEQEVVEALQLKGYCCYEGGNLYKQDWKESERCLSRVFDLTADASVANSLGYIYYYGRIDGRPDYAKAYKYFTFGAAGGYYESQYKLGDMAYYGLGQPKNVELARIIYGEMYDETVEDFIENPASVNKFADCALRMAMMEKENPEIDWYMVRKYILEADLAIRMRMQMCDYYGDDRVRKNIDVLMEESARHYSVPDSTKTGDLSFVEETFCPDGALGKAVITQGSNGKCSITFSSVDEKDNTKPYDGNLLLTIPDNDLCEFVDSYTIKTTTLQGAMGEKGKRTVFFDSTPTAFDGTLVLSLDGKVVDELIAKDWSITK